MILFNSTQRSSRLDYTLDYVFNQRLGIGFEWTDASTITNPSDYFIYYGPTNNQANKTVLPHGLLFDEGVKKQYHVADFLHLSDFDFEQATWPDALSAIFFHLSRYEEYQSNSTDEHGRFDAEQSCLKAVGFQPIIDVWIHAFKQHLIEKAGYSPNAFKTEQFQHVPSIDIDAVYAYKGRSILRTGLAFAKDLLFCRFSELKQRAQVLLGKQPDPNDNFNWQFEALKPHTANYFFLLGPYGQYDKNISIKAEGFKDIIQAVQKAGHIVGIHPSYASYLNQAEVLQQKQTLEGIIGTKVLHARQHFLRFKLPDSYHLLLSIGIQHEHSMGYSKTAGFRAATAQCFYWFDLENNQVTDLCIHPFVAMDVAFKQHQQLTAEASIQASSDWIKICKTLQIPFTFVFHNESLSQHRGWQHFDALFQYWCHGKH